MAYTIIREQLRERLLQDRMISAQAMLAGLKGSNGRPVELVDVEKELAELDVRLRRPLNFDRLREAYLREVTS